jgi:hypothetical protein
MTPYERGYNITLRKLGCFCKTAGYWQNIVGFDDLDQFNKSRQEMLAAHAAESEYDKAENDYLTSQLGNEPERKLSPSFWGKLTGKKPITNPEWETYTNKAKDLRQQYWKDNPSPENPYDLGDRTFTPKTLGGEELAVFSKYFGHPEMVGFSPIEHMSGDETGRGYLPKQELVEYLERMGPDQQSGWGPMQPGEDTYGDKVDLLKMLQDSPYQYFTSTDAG